MSTSNSGDEAQTQLFVEEITSLICRKLSALMAVAYADMAEQLGLTLTEIKALEVVHELGPLPTGQLMHMLCLSTGGTTALLNRLESFGFVERSRHPLDRRAVIVQEVPGANKMSSALDSLAEEIALVSRQYDAGQLRTVLSFLGQCARGFRHETHVRLGLRHNDTGRLATL